MLIRNNGWIQTVCISSSSAIWFIQRGEIYPDNGLFDSKEFKLMDFYENLNCPLLMFDSITVMILKEKCYQFLTIWYACNFTHSSVKDTLIICCLILHTGIHIKV